MPRSAIVWHKNSRMSKLAGISLLQTGDYRTQKRVKPYAKHICGGLETVTLSEARVAKRIKATMLYKGESRKALQVPNK